jgi:hypothetical protein
MEGVTMAGFKKATKAAAKLRAAFFGPSGAGKTFSALRVGAGLGGPIAVIDTERGSASKYSDRFDFDVLDLEDQSIEGYVSAIAMAAEGGYRVLVIDSLSHGWQDLTAEVEKLAKAKYRGNTWSAWSEGTPLQRRLVNAILGFPGHIIATMRSKTEWTTVDSNGKKTPQRVGLAPEQGKGIEYEFDLLVEISVEHIGQVIKDRTGKFQDKLIDKPGEQFGQQLAAWLADGTPTPVAPPAAQPVKAPATKPTRASGADLVEIVRKHIAAAATVKDLGKVVDGIDKALSEGRLSDDDWSQLTDEANARHEEIEPTTQETVTNG